MKCFLPYTEMNIWLKKDGFLFSPCCKISPTKSEYNIGLEKFIKSETLEDVKQGLNNLSDFYTPKNCNYCWENEQKGLKSWRNLQGEIPLKWKNNIKNIVNQERHFLVNFIKIALDQTCDSGCVYCGPDNSSFWATEIANNKQQTELYLESKHNKNIRINTTLYDDSKIFLKNYLNYIGSKIYKYEPYTNLAFLGGEPFLSPFLKEGQFIDYIDAFFEYCDPDYNLIYEFNTNGNTPQKIIDKNIIILKDSKKQYSKSVPKIILSGEAYGKAFEYVRYGTKWNTFITNAEKYISQFWLQVGFMLSVNIFSIPSLHLYFENILKLAKKYNHPISIICGTVYFPKSMHPAVLENNDINQNYIDLAIKVLGKYENYIWQQNFNVLIDKLQSFKNELGSKKYEVPNLQRYIKYINNVRKQNIKDYIPELSYLES